MMRARRLRALLRCALMPCVLARAEGRYAGAAATPARRADFFFFYMRCRHTRYAVAMMLMLRESRRARYAYVDGR